MLFKQTNKHSLAVTGSTKTNLFVSFVSTISFRPFFASSITALFILVPSILISSTISIDSVSAYTATINTDDNISLDILPTGDGTTIRSTSVNIQSDCRAGYNLNIATPNGSSLYKYSNNTQSSSTASFTSVDGTSALSSSNNTNKWGYTLTSNPTSSTIFSPLSSTASTIKTSTETASPDNDIDDTFNINYGIKADSSVEPGNYQMADDGNGNAGSIVYYLTMDTTCTQYTVQFNPNGGTVTSGGNNPTQGIEPGEPTKLASKDSLKAPTEASYTDADNNLVIGDIGKLWTFWGWNTQADGTGDWYKDREEVEDLASVGSTITLYAQWKQATLADMVAAPATQPTDPKQIDHNLMQDMSPETCYNSNAYSIDTSSPAHTPYDASTNIGGYHTITLLDYRGKVITGNNPEQPEQYTVSKLADGLCWMTKNLNLGRESGGPNNDGTITLTSSDTDLSDNTTFTLPAHTTTSSTVSTDVRIRTTNNSGNNNNGTYYSWAAAVADTTSTNTNPTTSICPKNWDLPASNQYSNLNTKSSYSSSNQTTASPSGFLNNGGFTDGATFYQTSYGHLWTSSSSTSTAYGARIENNRILVSLTAGTTYGGNKYYEKNIRCVASQGRATINYDGNGTSEYPTTGSVASQTNVEISSTNTRSNGFTRTGWTFNNWNTAPDGSGITIAEGASLNTLNLKPGNTITLYAQWTPRYTITYVHNCKSWASNDVNCTNTKSISTLTQTINLNTSGDGSGTLKAYNAWTNLSGWKIVGWNTAADGTGIEYNTSSTYQITGASAGDSITLYARWAPVYTVQYDGNGADNSNGMGNIIDANTGIKSVRHTNVAEGDTFDLFASNFKKNGFGFVGWSTDANAWNKLIDNDTTNDAKIWGPNEVIVAPAYNGTSITTLYAVWAPAETSGGNPVYLQNWNGCATMTATSYNSITGKLVVAKNTVTALTDQRDGEVYAVAKLADGNCWMIENLRLADGHVENNNTVATVLGASNTNIDGSSNSLPLTNIYNADSSLATKSYSLSPSSSRNSTDDISYGWCSSSSADCIDQSRLNTENTITDVIPNQTQFIDSANAHAHFNSNVYSYGNYYNWYSASAGYGVYSDNYGEVEGDICPAGWKIPFGTSDNSSDINKEGGYYYLADQMDGASNNQANSNKMRSFPNNFVFSGVWSGNSAADRGLSSNYWSSVGKNKPTVYSFKMTTRGVELGYAYSDKYLGMPVRCIKDEGIGEVEEMQEIANLSASDLASLKSSMTEGRQYRMRDSRDSKIYTVSKLADGRIWMTQNLDLDIDANTTYNNTNTDIGWNSSTGSYGTASWTPSTSTRTTGTTAWNDTPIAPESYDAGNIYWNGTTSDTSDWETYYGTCSDFLSCDESLNPLANYISTSGISQYHLGNYYNWTAAIAMNDSNNVAWGDVDQSICPAGWTLPKADNSVGSYEYLFTRYGWSSNTYELSNGRLAYQSPMYLMLGGLWKGAAFFVGYGGGFWTPTAVDPNAYYASIYTDAYSGGLVHPADGYWRNTGVAVRCVTRR